MTRPDKEIEMIIYSPETENKNEMFINFRNSDIFLRDKNNILIYVNSQKTPAMTWEYEQENRAKQVFNGLMNAIINGKKLFRMPIR